ncbi:MAG: Uma2 family endonuclease, partial [Cyanobacteria bacterium P01_H01_bin.152]
LKFGCQMGWLIDPAMKAVFVYPAQQQPEIFPLSQQKLPIPEFVGDWQLSVDELFAWLRPGSA